ncbi:FecR family protein [Hymenobacter sp. GOD-10R]|uniref:FecR family protein n=1 Tax=Hymenobacter sp. GOD-10R TaxID=3093922 RepID=UPI002D792FF8|nr:FecR domain-containing protein [Hymenobacter sp. GOD-10R]WRQ30641.1 FecR domain-containing protein [Hymenobacter sp. GOD-10R]
MKSYADYNPYATDDFLADTAFRAWIRQPTPEMDAYWRGLLKTNPQLRDAFAEARLLAQGLESTWTSFSDAYVESLYERLRVPHTTPRLRARRSSRRLVAAAAAVLLVGSGWAYSYFMVPQRIQTAFGEVRTLTLYDGSVVTLAANTQLEIPSRYQWQQSRQVWLKGEGYFVVQKQKQHDQAGAYRKFVVHTQRVDVAVLGTRFSLYTRPKQMQVVLEEGSIELTDAATRQHLFMQPGQVVQYAPKEQFYHLQPAATAHKRQLTVWRENLLVFNGATMNELARRFKEVYGLELVLQGELFTKQQFVGELPVDDVQKALLILSETFGAKAVRDGAQVYFISNDQVKSQ